MIKTLLKKTQPPPPKEIVTRANGVDLKFRVHLHVEKVAMQRHGDHWASTRDHAKLYHKLVELVGAVVAAAVAGVGGNGNGISWGCQYHEVANHCCCCCLLLLNGYFFKENNYC